MKRSGGEGVDRAVAVWRGLAPRERRLTMALGLVALTAATLVVTEWSARRRDDWALAVADRALQDQAVVRGRPATADLRDLDRMAGGALTAPDIWRARILLEQRLFAAAEAAGLESARITVDEADGEAAPPSVLGAGVEATYDGGALVRFLDSLEAGVGPHAVQEMAVDREDGGVVLRLVFPVVLEPGAAA